MTHLPVTLDQTHKEVYEVPRLARPQLLDKLLLQSQGHAAHGDCASHARLLLGGGWSRSDEEKEEKFIFHLTPDLPGVLAQPSLRL